MTSTAVVGSTGLVGSHILSTLVALPSISSVHALARRAPKQSEAKLHSLVSADTAQWPSQLLAIQPPPSILFSGLGTTRAAAGSFENQRKIDYDLNLSLAEAAKSAGVRVYVLISTSAASPTSRFGYPRMKSELDEAVKKLGFEHTIIVKPGLILGHREESRTFEWLAQTMARTIGGVSPSLQDSWAQDADVIAKAAVNAGLKALEGGAPAVWELGQGDIVRLGRTEWKA